MTSVAGSLLGAVARPFSFAVDGILSIWRLGLRGEAAAPGRHIVVFLMLRDWPCSDTSSVGLV
jgi:hypothetical protein